MPPKAVRGLSRRASGQLPETQQLKFLLEASALLSQSCPQVAAVLGRRALQVADGERALLPRGAAATLCYHCGLPFTAEVYQSGQVVRLRRQYIRRKLRAAEGLERGGPSQPGPKQVNRAAVIYSCKLCGHNTVRLFYTAAAAHQAVHKAGGPPAPVQGQQQAAVALGHPPARPATQLGPSAALAGAAAQLGLSTAAAATPAATTGAAVVAAAAAAEEEEAEEEVVDGGGAQAQARATAAMPGEKAVAEPLPAPQGADAGAVGPVASAAAEPLPALEAREGGQAQPEADGGLAAMPASNSEVGQPPAHPTPAATHPAAAGACTCSVVQAAQPVSPPYTAEGKQGVFSTTHGTQQPCPSAPLAAAEPAASTLPRSPPECSVQASLGAAAARPPPEQPNSSVGGSTAFTSALPTSQAEHAGQGGGGAGEPAASAAPAGTALPDEEPATEVLPNGDSASPALEEGAPLLGEQQQQAGDGAEAEVSAAVNHAVSSEPAGKGMLVAAGREQAGVCAQSGLEEGHPAGSGQAMLLLEPAAFAFNFTLEGAVALEPPSGAAGPALAAAAPPALPVQASAEEGPSQPGAPLTPALPVLDTGKEEEEEGEGEQQLARKKRRISWSPRLEDVQIIPSAPMPPQQLSWAAAGAAAAGSSPTGGQVVRKKAWFRVGRRWKCAGV